MNKFDVIIVGGGPAGATLGYMLKKANISVCIIEKAKFPRFKLCGGLLTEKSVEFLESLYQEKFVEYKAKTNIVTMYLGMDKISRVETDSTFHLVERVDFDEYLINKYKQIGGTIFENCQITDIDLENNQLKTNDFQTLKYDIIVGADGANSKIRKLIDDKFKPNAFCIEATFKNENYKNEIDIYFSIINDGYGWIFPKGNYYTMGIGGILDKNTNMMKNFNDFYIATKSNKDEISNKKGAFIPFGKFVKKPCKNNIILIGDAAGFVDPITGEGIYFAFKSAEIAMSAIIGTQSNNHAGLETFYYHGVKEIQAIINDANFFNFFFNRKSLKKLILKLVKGKSNILNYVCKNLLSNYNVSYKALAIKYFFVRKERKHNEKQSKRK